MGITAHGEFGDSKQKNLGNRRDKLTELFTMRFWLRLGLIDLRNRLERIWSTLRPLEIASNPQFVVDLSSPNLTYIISPITLIVGDFRPICGQKAVRVKPI